MGPRFRHDAELRSRRRCTIGKGRHRALIPYERHPQVLGEVFGLTVRSRNIGSQFGAGLKSLVGGELKGMTKNLVSSRYEVINRMAEEAAAKGADAVLAMRFDTSEMGGN